MRIIGAKTGILFCSMAIASYGCAMIAGLDENVYNQDPPSGTAGTSGGGGGGGGSIGSGGAGTGGTSGTGGMATPVGEPIWSEGISGMSVTVNDMAVDGAGNIWLVGTFKDTISFFPNSVSKDVSATVDTAFVAKLGSDGKVLEVKPLIDQLNASPTSGVGIDVTANGNAYVIGSFEGTVKFNDVGISMTANGKLNTFIAILDANVTIKDAKGLISSGMDISQNPTSIAVNRAVNPPYEFAIGGSFSGTIELLGNSITSAGGTDGFVATFHRDPMNGSLTHYWSQLLNSPDPAFKEDSITAIAIMPEDSSVAVVGTCGPTPSLSNTSLPTAITTYGTHICMGRLTKDLGAVINSPNILYTASNCTDPFCVAMMSGSGAEHTVKSVSWARINSEDKLLIGGSYFRTLAFGMQSITVPSDAMTMQLNPTSNGFAALFNANDFTDSNNLLMNVGGNQAGDGNETISTAAGGEDNEFYLGGSLDSNAFLTVDMNTQPPLTVADSLFVSKLSYAAGMYSVQSGFFSTDPISNAFKLMKVLHMKSDHTTMVFGRYSGSLTYLGPSSTVNSGVSVLPKADQTATFITKLNF